ncbi:hypothetical protein FHR81_005065 [Actinoalloteichus hoggarensis]|uniref:Uncharacterized protein n=1 Tax=Actinoalloteichus hoggarensis TaxID=1470176 RepID=A0A221WA36_9PSEU|nr:hypothetical protein [Actinoalloteichus hoggarensis]ASO22870.1 hypothetical protein AHOG_26325 [Actinoalloteichus hoggarensis]MBB5923988.1 hypothetical protein [Actinoalloteichus hoggarensis]
MTSSEKQKDVDVAEFEAQFPPVEEGVADVTDSTTEVAAPGKETGPRRPSPSGGVGDPLSEPGKTN